MNAPDETRYLVPGLTRGLRILQCFTRQSPRLSAAEIGRSLGLPRASAFRLIQTLEHLEFLERENNMYRLGPAVLGLGFEYLASQGMTEKARPVVEGLRDKLGYSAHLAIRDGADAVVLLKAAGPSAFSSWVNVGTRLPAHATVLGRVLLEDLSLPQLRALYPEEHLEVFSSNTPKTVVELFDMVQADKERGFVLQEGFFETSISTVAAPVRDHSGNVVAAMGATIPSPHIDASQLDIIVARVRDTAAELSRLLDHAPQGGAKVVNMWRG